MKLLASDYDETLLIDNQISTQDLAAIANFQSAGNLFGLNSGRHLDSIFEECDRFSLNCDFYIGNNGTIVLNRDREVIYIANFKRSLVKEILQYFRTHLREEVYFISVNNGYQFGREFFNEGSDFLVDHTHPLEWYLDKPISTMFSEVIDIKQTMSIVNHLNQVFNGRAVFYGNAPYIDIVNEHIDKATGIEVVADYYQIDLKHCYAIGDNYNDISMLTKFNSYVMSHATASVKKAAKKEVHSIAQAILDLSQQ